MHNALAVDKYQAVGETANQLLQDIIFVFGSCLVALVKGSVLEYVEFHSSMLFLGPRPEHIFQVTKVNLALISWLVINLRLAVPK